MSRAYRLGVALAGVAALTAIATRLIPVNPTTVGSAYLLWVLVIASTLGFLPAAVASVASTLAFNYFFLPPLGTFVIADPQNWVGLFTFLATALIASRLSDKAERRAQDAIARRQDLERLYGFSRSLLLMDSSSSFPKQLADKLAEIFPVEAVVLYVRGADEFYRAGPEEFAGLENQLREAAQHGNSYAQPEGASVITPVRLGSEPIAALAVQGARMPEAVLQGIVNLVAIGLERARAQEMAHEIEAAQRSEHLRTTLLDAMAHEFKTPLTSIKAATTALRADPEQPAGSRMELVAIADEEAEHLRELIDSAVEMARLDMSRIDLHVEASDLGTTVREVLASMHNEVEDRPVELACGEALARALFDRRLVRLALKQLLDNALKYSPPRLPIRVAVSACAGEVAVEITDRGKGIPAEEQRRVFERFYRSPSVKHHIPGSGLGLTIAHSIVEAHRGELTVRSRPGETTFRMALPRAEPGGSR